MELTVQEKLEQAKALAKAYRQQEYQAYLGWRAATAAGLHDQAQYLDRQRQQWVAGARAVEEEIAMLEAQLKEDEAAG